MPNWCANCLTVTGDPVEIRRFEKFLRGYDREWNFRPVLEPREEAVRKGLLEMPPLPCHTYDTAVPVPPEVLMQDFSGKGYDWQVSNWGCKWDLGDEVRLDVGEGTLTLSWDSPWGPPTEWAVALASQFPLLEMEMIYIETGNAFAGRIRSSEGDGTVDEYSWPDEGYREIAEEFGVEFEDEEDEAEKEEEEEEEEGKEEPEDRDPGEGGNVDGPENEPGL